MELTPQEISVQANAMIAFFNQKLAEALAEIARLNGAVAILELRLKEAQAALLANERDIAMRFGGCDPEDSEPVDG